MMSRRALLQAAAFPAIVALVAPPAFATHLGGLPFQDVVADTSSTAGTSFARAARANALPLVEAGQDVTDYWTRQLSSLWSDDASAQTRPIAGLTRHGPLFVLERFGWMRGMRVAYRGQHRIDAAGRIEHEIAGPASLIDRLTRTLLEAGGDFAPALAEAFARYPAEVGMQRTTIVSTQTRATGMDEPLYSYVIAAQRHGLRPYSHSHSA